jgi:hypothetical protein
VVIEIAIRRMLQAVREATAEWSRDHQWVEPAIGEYPGVLYSAGEHQRSPVCLLLRLAPFERPGYRPEIRGVYRRLVVWDISPGIDLRDKRGPGATDNQTTPSARELWNWATASPKKIWSRKEKDDVRRWLGEL